ncbi:TraR/DksA family transcriptional regulator [Rugamonas sp. CCM 8940]|uniref:TraR/DksA family transcriptional regulator n=1 Tax=Rugamonas sp. CCM 8940 TaxID=2765359 RepID=UPI0018F6625F|nr:TraR/DksA family transcriptional regulator [Rugamonas sp. CCM 8940]MBJ7310464.1 TraR/DksA family transcriptional regulator [Rugamonas sp. CCM 8940]
MTPFAKQLLDEFGEQLRAQRLRLIANLRERMHQGDDPQHLALANFFENGGEQAEATMENDANLAQLSHELAELRSVDAALGRIAGGTYGSCVNCGALIGSERLRAQPDARMCLACQEEAEQHPNRQRVRPH